MSNSFITNFAVGPAKLYHSSGDFLCEQIQIGTSELSHRSAEFSEISKKTLKNFRNFFRIPENYKILYTYSATESMEILTRSCVNDKICHVSNGTFGDVWTKTSKKAQKKVQKFSNVYDSDKTPDNYRVKLEEIQPEEGTEFLAITANETSTGIMYSPEELSIIRDKYPDILLGVDVTSSMGAISYDFSRADAWFFSVQKAFGMPAGLGLLIVSPRVLAKATEREKAGKDVGCHHTLSAFIKKIEGKAQTPTTPNGLNIALLGFVCEQFNKNFGKLETLYELTQKKAKFLYDFFSRYDGIDIAIEEEKARSQSVITLSGTEEQVANMHSKWKKAGLSVGAGYGSRKKDQIRIANFPVHSFDDMENLVKAL